MDDEKLRAAFKRAAEVASVVPESMHEAAFNRALDALLGVSDSAPQPPAKKTSSRKLEEVPAPKAAPPDPVAALQAMKRSQAGEVDAADGGMAKALALLLVARRELEIDGLSSQQIATVLTDKFRWRVTRQAISQAMDAAGNRVDRVKRGRGSQYRIMEAGEDWLARPATEREPESGGPATRVQPARRRRRRAKRTSKEPPSINRSSSEPAAPSAARRSASQGPKAAVESLIDSGWFEAPRGLSDIRTELEHRLAMRFKATDLSPALTRLLREGRLRRAKSDAGQYEYKSHKP